MYKVIKNGVEIAITDELTFIKQTADSVFVLCTEDEAQGVAVRNTPYNLLGRGGMTDCETVVVAKVDGGEHIEAGEASQLETDVLVVDHEYRLTLLELGVVE